MRQVRGSVAGHCSGTSCKRPAGAAAAGEEPPPGTTGTVLIQRKILWERLFGSRRGRRRAEQCRQHEELMAHPARGVLKEVPSYLGGTPSRLTREIHVSGYPLVY